MRWAHLVVPLLLLLATVVPSASGQVFLEPGEREVEVEPGQPGYANFTLKNPLNRSLAGFARLDGDLASEATVDPREFRLQAAGTRDLTVVLPANTLSEGLHSATLRVLLVDQETGDTERLSANLTAIVPAPLLLFGVWETPLPAPFHGPWTLFLIEVTTWIVAAYVIMRASAISTKLALTRVPNWVREQVVAPLRGPIFVLALAAGIRWAWRFFPPEGWTGLVQGLLDAVVVLSVAFLIYRSVDAGLTYVKEEVAPKTETTWDDVIAPVSKKIALALLAGFAFFYALAELGVNLGFLVAGGLIIGLVLSNSLGPTLQNLFSGVFLLIDRPMTEGDDIRLDTGEVCNVKRIGLRSTRLYYYRNHEMIIVPNKDLESARIVNLHHPDTTYKMHIVVGVAYGSPVERVKELLLQVAEEHPEVEINEELRSGVFFDDFADSALLFRLAVFVSDAAERFRISSEVREAIDRTFAENGITIPFPQRTLWMNEGTGRPRGLERDGDGDPAAPALVEEDPAEGGPKGEEDNSPPGRR